MGYLGGSYPITFNGGFTFNQNIAGIPENMMVNPSRNVILGKGGWEPRGGTTPLNATPISGSPRIMSSIDFILDNGNQFVLKATADGKIYKNATDTIKTGLTVNKFTSFVVMRDSSDVMNVYFTNGVDTPQVWDGVAANSSAITNPASDWTGSNVPFQFIEHGIEESRRLCAITTKAIYISALDAPGEFITGVIKIPIDDILVGATEFQDRLLPFSKNQFYILDDTNTDSSKWGIYKAIWKAGCSHWRNVVKTATDIVCFTNTGFIYSIATAFEYGDYKIGDLSGAPFYMGDFIRTKCKLSSIEDFHTVYDEELRRILFFVVMNGKSQVTTALPFYVDLKLWASPLENQSFACGFDASCSTIVTETPAGNHSKYVYTGDHSGKEWKLAEANNNDDGNPYYMGFHTPRWFFGNGRATKHYSAGWPILKVQGSFSININTWIFRDGVEAKLPVQTVSLQGGSDVFGTAEFGTAVFSGNDLLTPEYDIGDVGEYIRKEFFVNGVNQDFFLSGVNIDHKVLGKEPQ